MDERLTEIEIKLAHVEQSLQELSDVVYRHDGLLERLEKSLGRLRDQLESGEAPSDNAGPADEKPPHY